MLQVPYFNSLEMLSFLKIRIKESDRAECHEILQELCPIPVEGNLIAGADISL